MTLSLSLRKPEGVLHLPRGRLTAPLMWPCSKSSAARTSTSTTSCFSLRAWLNSIGPVVNAILSSKYCRALSGSFFMKVLVIYFGVRFLFFRLVCFDFIQLHRRTTIPSCDRNHKRSAPVSDACVNESGECLAVDEEVSP